MLNRNISTFAECLGNTHAKKQILHSCAKGNPVKNKNFIHTYVQKTLSTHQNRIKHLHLNSKSTPYFSTLKSSTFLKNLQYKFSTQQQPKIDYNNLNVINDLQSISQNANKFNFQHNKNSFLSNQYPTIAMDFDKKLQKIEAILNSQQKDLYKIVQQTIIVLEAFAMTRRRQIIQENAVKVVKQFNQKIISVYLQSIQGREIQEIERRKNEKKVNEIENKNTQQTDNNYLLHENYSVSSPELAEKDFIDINGFPNGIIDINFIFYYLETIKGWLLNRIETESIIREAEEQIFQLLASRQVSDLPEVLKQTMQHLIRNYIEEPSAKKRELFPFDLKLRGISLLSFFDNNQLVEKYLQRLADQNMFIYMKESQIVSLMYDITEIQPDLSNISHFVYQVQSTKVYQNLSTMNGAFIKALFINYTRKFMVSFQQIQFYELFRDIEPKIKYPTIRTFIRLIQILKTQAGDLHCEYNKLMNKYNYNILISIITSQSYTVENTRFDELFELFETLNSLQRAGQVLYEEISKYLRHYIVKENYQLKENELQRIYKLFEFVIEQTKPLYKYEQKQGLNKQFGKKTTLLLNTLFDVLLHNHPEVILIGNKFIKAYLLSDENSSNSSIYGLPYDDREINIELQNSTIVESKLQKVKFAFNKLIENKVPNADLLDTILIFMKTSVHLIKGEGDIQNGTSFLKFPQNFKLLQYFYLTEPSKTFEESLFNKTLKPLLKELSEGILANQNGKKSSNELGKHTRTLVKTLECINSLNLNKQTLSQINNSLKTTKNSLISQIKERLQEKEKQEERKRLLDIETLTMAIPKGNTEILLCLHELSKLAQRLQTSINTNGSSQPYSFLQQLPLIYNFINTIAIQNMKSLQETDLIPMLLFIKSLEDARTSQKDNVLLLEINTSVYEYLYSALSVFIIFIGDRGKYYLKLNNNNAENFLSIINHFVANKSKFRSLDTKKRLVILQAILFGLIKKKHLKVTSAHLKRSQHAKILLSFLEIFQYPENLNSDLKKIIQEVEFLTNDLQEFSNDILERYSDINWSISRHLEDNKVGLTSSKKLGKLTVQQLRKEFEQGKKSKIYEMILRNSKYQLPFDIPEPKIDDQNTKLIYIIEKIYQKISNKNNYGVPRVNSKSMVNSFSSKISKKSKKFNQSFSQPVNEQHKPLQEIQKRDDEVSIYEDNEKLTIQQSTNGFARFQQIDLQQQKSYVKRQSLVNYIYEDHYKMSENKLPLHFKKQTWKNLSSISKQLEIQTLEIDQKIDQNIYKQVMLALLGYVEKVKMVAKEFHSHSFIQYVAAQLDMEVFFHGCIARISRKNKPQENVLFVCSIESNYKLLYICTHILRESGENAFIISEKTKDVDFKDFLEKLLPQPFEPEESQIVDKVVKGEIGIDGQDSGIIKQEI